MNYEASYSLMSAMQNGMHYMQLHNVLDY